MGLEAFNSRFLELVQKNYKGPFYGKFLQSLDVLAKTGSMEEACSKLFRTSIQPIDPPKYETLVNFGKGNLAQDYLTLLYLDDLLGRAFDLIKQARFKDALKHLSESGVFPDFSEEKDLEIFTPVVEKIRNLPQDIAFRFEIYMAMAFACLWKKIPFEKKVYTIGDKEELSFLGIASMLDRFFLEKGRSNRFVIDFNVNIPKNLIFSSQNFFLSKNQLIPFQIEKDQGQGPIISYPEMFDQFLRINQNYELQTTKKDLNISISNILSSGSFIWDSQVFGLSTEEIEAMNSSQRLLFLIQNKSKTVDRCLEHLLDRGPRYTSELKDGDIVLEYNPPSPLEKNIQANKSKMIGLSKQIEQTLNDINLLESKYRQFELSKKKSKDALYQLAANMGQNQTKTLLELLDYIEKGTAIESSLPRHGLDQLIHKLLEEYKHSFFQAASYKERAKESQEQLKFYRNKLANAFSSIMNSASERSLENLFDSQRFLEVYAVFSFIVFNEDIFPDISFREYSKEQGLKKLAKIFNKRSNEKRLAVQAFDRIAQKTPSDIEELLNRQAKKIFKAFSPTKESYKIKTLSPSDMNAIRDVTQKIISLAENGNKQAFENFDRLKEIIKDLLLRDEVFLGSIDQLESRYSLNKLASLQAHIEACLLFVEGDESTISTGLPQAVGFKKLLQDILYSLGDESIKLSKLKESDHVVQAIKHFSLPIPAKETFRQAIQKEIISTTTTDLSSRAIEIQQLPVEELAPELRQMRSLLELFKEGIVQRLKKFEGANEFLSQKAPKKQLDIPFSEMMRLEFDAYEDSKIHLSESDREFLKHRFQGKVFNANEVQQAVTQFILDNDIQTSILNPDSLIHKLMNTRRSGFYLLGRIAVYQNLLNEYQRIIEKLRMQKSYKIVPVNQGNEQSQANVFSNQTLFRFYEQIKNTSNENRALTFGVYKQFLPIFIASFFDDIQGLRIGQDFFMDKKFDLIRHLPDAEKTYAEIRALLQGKYAQLQNLSTYLEKSLQEGSAFEEGWLEKTKKYIQTEFGELSSNLTSFTVNSVIFTVAAAIAFKGKPTLSAICGVISAFAWQMGFKPVLNQMYQFAKESYKYYLTDKYTDKGINQLILDLINVSFRTEIQSIPKFETLEQRLSFISFLQEEFSIMRNLKNDLNEFSSRLNYLVPNTLANMNFSAMAMNFFYTFNKELFLVSPPELLKNAQSPLFFEALQEYLQAYQDLIKQRQRDYEGSTEDAKISYGKETPFSRILKQEAAQQKLFLEFSRDSNVHKFLQSLRSDLGSTYRVNISPGQIVPMENFDPLSLIQNLQNFLKLSEELLKQEQQFYGYMSFTLKEAKAASLPINAENENKALQGLISSYYIMRHCLSTAKRVYDTQDLPDIAEQDVFLQSVGETAENLLTSSLFRETLSVMRKTLEFAVESELYGSREGLRFMIEIEDSINRFMQTGVLILPPWESIDAFIHSLSTIARQVNDNPQVLIPMLMEYERNKNLFLPHIIWQQAIEFLDESVKKVPVVIKGNYTSKTLYLTNSDADIFFSSRQGRGFALSPFVVEALQATVQKSDNLDLLKYLGLMSSQVDLMRESQGAIPRFLDKIRSFLPGSKKQPLALENGNPQMQNESNSQANLAPGMSYVPENQRKPFENAPTNQQPIGNPSIAFDNKMPMGQQNPQMPMQNQDPNLNLQPGQNAIQPAQGVPNQVVSNQPTSQSMNSGILPIPMMMNDLGGEMNQGQKLSPMEEGQPQMEMIPEQKEAENQNMVMVNADGGSGSHSVGGFGGDYNPNPLQEAENNFNQNLDDAFNRPNIGPNMPIGGPYNNPLNQNYEPAQPNQGFPYGKAAMIGGGMVLGAALLSQMLKKDEKTKRKR